MYSIEGENLIPLFKEINGIKEPYNECRQHLPDTYIHTGYIDIFNSKIVRKGTISGDRVYPYVLENTGIVDIDTMYDWEKAEKLLS